MYKQGIPAEFLARQDQRDTRFRMDRFGMDNMVTPEPDEENPRRIKEQADAQREQYLRLAADFDNYKKRITREIDERVATQKGALVRDLLPAVDNLERALATIPPSAATLREGVKLVLDQLVGALQRHGYEPRQDLGQTFDGKLHDAIAIQADPSKGDQLILEVWERGWMHGQKLFRPAKVLVNNLNQVQQNSPETPDFSKELRPLKERLCSAG